MAFNPHAPLKQVKLEDALGQISKEAVMIYPPGIPLIIPGEEFDEEVINIIKYYKKTCATIISENPGCDIVNVVDKDNIDINHFEPANE